MSDDLSYALLLKGGLRIWHGSVYKILADQQVESHGYLRVIDESGEDYGYSKDRFIILEIPKALEEVLFEKMA